MAESRWIETIIEQAQQAVSALTRQVSRVAYALEKPMHNTYVHTTCKTCMSTLQKTNNTHCMACGEEMKRE